MTTESSGSGSPEATEAPTPTSGEVSPGSTGTLPEETAESTGVTVGTTSGASSTSTSTSTGDSSPICGDGVIDVELGEECDDGYAVNNDESECTFQCRLAYCGDGLIWAGEEECDNADENNDTIYNGCTTQCRVGAACGDGVVQGPEECDLADVNGTPEGPPGGVACTIGCRFVGKIAFLSSGVYDGDDLGGVGGAHIKCQLAAAAAGFDNSSMFKAWLSTDVVGPAAWLVDDGLPYTRPDGVRLAFDLADLLADGPGDGIVMTEKKEILLDWAVWTGSDPTGLPFDPPHNCAGWTSASPVLKGRVGRSGLDKADGGYQQWVEQKHWSSFASLSCDVEYRIYCVEQ